MVKKHPNHSSDMGKDIEGIILSNLDVKTSTIVMASGKRSRMIGVIQPKEKSAKAKVA